ncbi:DNA repair metallo-beta-lactamase protein, putative [Plasmodium gallinaceum]|uniref:DNA repair metallo-beta-lactamase protein, putative n=1 Tax=Plasmodium gallinaceum TaxID=5849 RepID=A0A1J1GPY4_PLAGA|nr:DNA repair metallo-beta-lactamase protein, putative [Plasmodium gallinaceum]CRG94575.1 DNA repair metallo-beta-lactamase protein, putative [Plasmodium gallinaceum]
MIYDNINVIQNNPLIIIDKFPYTKKKEINIDKNVEKKKITKIYFLTHFHADHYMNINRHFNENVFTSTITKSLLVNIIGINEKYVHNLKINTNYYLFNFEVIFIDANHCPGSVIICFQFLNGTKIIHTGDFRYSNIHSFLIKKLLNFTNVKEEKDKENVLKELETLEMKNNILLKKKESKKYIVFNNNIYNICYIKENFTIYKSNKYIVSIEEFRIVYLKIIEELLLNMKNIKNQFFLYDSIEFENFFSYFIFIELLLYFNQNEQEISILYEDKKLNESDIILNNENIKNIRFNLNFLKKEEIKTNCSFIDKTELLNCKNYELYDMNSKKIFESKNINKENIKIENKEDTYEEYASFNESCCHMKSRERSKIKNILKKKNNDLIKSNRNIYLNELKENSNYIKTIYLDTTYALTKNNLFPPQMYLVNYIIYLCKKKINNDSYNEYDLNKINYLSDKKKRNEKTNEEIEEQKKENNKKEIYVKKEKKEENRNEKKENNKKEIHVMKEKKEENREKVYEGKENIILKNKRVSKKTLFLFGTYNLGKEKIYLSVSEACNMKIYFKNKKKKIIIESFLNNKNILDRITDDKLEAQIHIVDINYSCIFPKIDKNKLKNLIDEEIEKEFDFFYYIIPTGWVKKYSFYEKKNISIFLIPYSEHSNLLELISFVKSIKPCNIIPTVFSNPKEKLKILNTFNSYLNLKEEVRNFLKIKNSNQIKNKRISKQNIKEQKEKKKNFKYKTKAEKIFCDKNQKKITSFFSFLKKEE